MRDISAMKAKKILHYFADPMCSWCWGFAPIISELHRSCDDHATLIIVTGGLRAGETRPMNDQTKDFIRQHWQAVEAATGQPFSYAFFEREGFVYDTALACRGVVAMRGLAPDLALDYFKTVQHAFYVENQDVTDMIVLAELAERFDVTPEQFLAAYTATDTGEALLEDFRTTQALGVPGFPAVLLQDASGFTPLTAGYHSLEELKPALDRWLAGQN
ncbi:MAG: DsbA family protein [Hyphomicrobiales bacterium]|nr:DsbA family protein [Hyphomicrobiales bacterium]